MSDRFIRRADAITVVQKLTVKAVLEKKLICKGDRILIAVSGGKDSTILAWALETIRPALKINYELAALHISTDFCTYCKKNALSRQLEEWGISFTDLFVPVIGRLKKGKKMNCYWCSTQRRSELIKYAMENNFNKIALGHHLDDIIETFFMNLCTKGEINTMPVMLQYQKYPVSIIRPLAFLEEKQIIACTEAQDKFKKFQWTPGICICPYGINSERIDIRHRIAGFTGGKGTVKRRILMALTKLKS